MRFLGSIGIDIRLLIAQMINFGILLWLLSRFIYRPIIKRIEEDEAELDAAQKQQEVLKKEQQEFEEQKRKDLKSTRDRYQSIIEEAETIGKEIGQKSRDKMEKEGEDILKQAQLQAKSLEYTAKKRVATDVAASIGKKMRALMKKELPKDAVSDMLFEVLIKEVGHLTHDMTDGVKPHVVVEYVVMPAAKQKKELEQALAKKFKKPVSMTMKKNEHLVGGFKMEFEGAIIESNIANIIHNATKDR